eukprot:5093562-Prymnesium_polylepis.1
MLPRRHSGHGEVHWHGGCGNVRLNVGGLQRLSWVGRRRLHRNRDDANGKQDARERSDQPEPRHDA